MTEKTYKIGEVAEILDLKSYVLRFWETEFPQLVPLRTEKGQRLYTESNVALLKSIKALLHEQGMTIDGARKILDGKRGSDPVSAVPTPQQIPLPGAPVPRPSAGQVGPQQVSSRLIRDELLAIRRLLTGHDLC